MTDQTRTVRLFARLVFPVVGPPIRDCLVTVRGGTIVDVAPYRSDDASPADDLIDLGSAALLPGLVNAHTHLELSDADRPLGEPGMPFTDWIRLVIAHRLASTQTIGERVARGLAECRASGTALLGDIVQPVETDDNVTQSSGEQSLPAVVEFLELIAPSPERVDETWQAVEPFLARTDPALHGLSPHAPYSTCGRLLQRAIELSRPREIPLTMHLAESADELRLLEHGDGPLRELLEEFGPWDPSDLAGLVPLDYVRLLAGAHRAILVHGNYLDNASIDFLGRARDRMSVVYCPRCHARFGHRRYPLERMLKAGVRVALGTDGRVSTPDLNLWSEMRQVAADFPDVSGATILRMGTTAGAEALGLADRFGTIQPGSVAAFACARFSGPSTEIADSVDPHRRLLESVKRLEPVSI